MPTISSERAKQLVNPDNMTIGVNPPLIDEMYKKTHGNFGPGEQKNRQYQWEIDVNKHRFGFGEKALVGGAALSLH